MKPILSKNPKHNRVYMDDMVYDLDNDYPINSVIKLSSKNLNIHLKVVKSKFNNCTHCRLNGFINGEDYCNIFDCKQKIRLDRTSVVFVPATKQDIMAAVLFNCLFYKTVIPKHNYGLFV